MSEEDTKKEEQDMRILMNILGFAPPNKDTWCINTKTGEITYINTETDETILKLPD